MIRQVLKYPDPRLRVHAAEVTVFDESVLEVAGHPERVAGLRFVHEPEYLRFFQSRFEPVRTRGTPAHAAGKGAILAV